LRLGQVSLILLWLVAEDDLGDQRRTRGVLTGLAAAIKVVPVFFLAYYLAVGRYRAAALGAITLTVVTAVTFFLLPEESTQYWLVDLLDASRVGAAIDFVSNQSLLGVWVRTFGQDPSNTLWWRMAMVAVAGLALVIARRMWQRRARLLSFGIAGLAVLLVSPISWTHHWVFFYPLLVGLAGYWSVRWVRVPVVVAVMVLLSRVVWRAPHEGGGALAMDWYWWPIANAYVLVGVMVAVAAVAVVWRVPASASADAAAESGQGTTVSTR
jgi:alpha-1,2-mannosyltransferase